MTRKPPSKLSRLDQLVKSHKHLLRAFRSLTQSNTELRKVVLEMRQEQAREALTRLEIGGYAKTAASRGNDEEWAAMERAGPRYFNDGKCSGWTWP